MVKVKRISQNSSFESNTIPPEELEDTQEEADKIIQIKTYVLPSEEKQ